MRDTNGKKGDGRPRRGGSWRGKVTLRRERQKSKTAEFIPQVDLDSSTKINNDS